MQAYKSILSNKSSFLQADSIVLGVHSQACSNYPNNKFTISLQYLKGNVKDQINFLPVDRSQSFLQSDFRCVWRGMSNLSKITNLLFLCNILRKKWVMKLIFCMYISRKTCYKLVLWFLWVLSSIPKDPKIASLQCLYNISKKKLEMKLIFSIQIKVKVFYKLISTL